MGDKLFGGKNKALTFSFDDGNLDDKALVEILNKYGFKSTFNINSGLLTENTPWNFKGIKQVKHINYLEFGDIYNGHEIAAHSYTHPDLIKLNHKDIVNQITIDKVIYVLFCIAAAVIDFFKCFSNFNPFSDVFC